MAKRTVKDKVESILRDYPDARDSDKKLIKYFWTFFHPGIIATNEAGDWVMLDHLMYLTSPETIRRCRQLIQNKEGKYPAADPVVSERRKREKGVKFTVNTNDPMRYLPD